MSSRPSTGFVRPLIAVALTAVVLWRAHPAAVLGALGHADLTWVGLAIALVVADRALMAYRSVVLLSPVAAEHRPPLLQLMRVFFVSTFAGTFLPTSVGGDVVRAYALTQLRVAPAAAVASVLMDRLLGVVSILLVGIVGLAVAPADLKWNASIDLALAVAAAACACGAAFVFLEPAANFAARLAERLPFAPVRRLGGELTRATRAYATHHGALLNVLAGSLGVQLLRVTQAFCLGRALGLMLPLPVYLALIPLILLVMLLPVSINGIGTGQVAFVWFFARASVDAADALALSILFVALGIVGNLPGGILYMVRPRPAPAAVK